MDLKDSTLPNAEAIEVQHEEVHQHEQTIWEAIKEAPGSLLWCTFSPTLSHGHQSVLTEIDTNGTAL